MEGQDNSLEGAQFLHKKYPDLQSSKEVKRAVVQLEKNAPLKSLSPAEKIDTYLTRIEGFFENPDEFKRERGKHLIKEMLHRQCVIQPEDVPENYFEAQRREAENAGKGSLYITPAYKAEETEAIIRMQTKSLDNWINYLASNDANYPAWSKYYILRNIVNLGQYDKEKKEFAKRSKGTTVPFPDINYEALAYVVDALEKNISKTNIDDPKLNTLLEQKASFSALYAYEIDKVASSKKETATSIEQDKVAGEWKKFPMGSEPQPLVDLITNRNTGWCTVTRAAGQLRGGDFYVYCTSDEHGKLIIPRIAIRMEKGRVAEVRGIEGAQNLEPLMFPAAEKMLSELPAGRQYERRFADMRRVTEIMKKVNDHLPVVEGDRYYRYKDGHQPLTREELRFMYEFDRPILSFGEDNFDTRVYYGFQYHTRIDRKSNLAIIFGCQPDEVTSYDESVNDTTIVYNGTAHSSAASLAHSHPNLKFITHDASFQDEKEYQSLGNIELIGRNGYFSDSIISDLGKLKTIGRTATFSNSQISDLGSLESIGEGNFIDSQVTSLGNLRTIWGYANFNRCPLSTLGNLEYIGGNVYFEDSPISNLGNLKRVDGDIYVYEDSILDFSHIQHGRIIREKRGV